MEYRKFDNIIIARIDKGEEILEQLKAIAITENIKLASINALGAINDFTVGVYKTDEKKYYSNSFKGYYEITSLTGTINTMDGEYYARAGTQLNYEVLSEAISAVRCSAPLGADWKRRIDEDYEKRGKGKKK